MSKPRFRNGPRSPDTNGSRTSANDRRSRKTLRMDFAIKPPRQTCFEEATTQMPPLSGRSLDTALADGHDCDDERIGEILEKRVKAAELRTKSRELEGEARREVLESALELEAEAVRLDPEFQELAAKAPDADPIEMAKELETMVRDRHEQVSRRRETKTRIISGEEDFDGDLLSAIDGINADIDRLEAEVIVLEQLEIDLEERALVCAVPELNMPDKDSVAGELYRWIANGLVSLRINVELRLCALLAIDDVDETLNKGITIPNDRRRAKEICKKIIHDEVKRIRSDKTLSGPAYTTEMITLTTAIKHLVGWAMLENKKQPGPWEKDRIAVLDSKEIRKRFEYLDLLRKRGDVISFVEMVKRGLAFYSADARIEEFGDRVNLNLYTSLDVVLQQKNKELGKPSKDPDINEVRVGIKIRAVIEAIPEKILAEDMQGSKTVLCRMTDTVESRRKALAIVNDVLNKRGIAIIENRGRVHICRITHTISYRGFSDARGIVVTGSNGEKPTGKAEAFFQSDSGLIAIKTPSIWQDIMGRSKDDVRCTYEHEFEHLVSKIAGLTSTLIKTGVADYRDEKERMEYVFGRLEGTAMARELVFEMERETELGVLDVLKKMVEIKRNSGFNDEAHKAGYALLYKALQPFALDTKPDKLERVIQALNNEVDKIYEEALGLPRSALFPKPSEIVPLGSFLYKDRVTEEEKVTRRYTGNENEAVILRRLEYAQNQWR